MKATELEIEMFKALFSIDKSYIQIWQIADTVIADFIDEYRDYSIDRQIDFFADYCMANQLCDVQA